LHAAVFHGRRDIVEVLIQAGAEIHTRGWNRETALRVALGKAYVSIIELLLSEGATLDGWNNSPMTATG
jgi:ankyrin repeat protein